MPAKSSKPRKSQSPDSFVDFVSRAVAEGDFDIERAQAGLDKVVKTQLSKSNSEKALDSKQAEK